MKVIVLGGAGDMGSRTVEDLAKAPDVSHVAIADKNVLGAERLARKLLGRRPKMQVLPIDADDHSRLVEVIRGYDVCASALGPFHRFEAKLARAAVEAGVDYVSICDEWEAVEEVIGSVHEQAVTAGRKVITGLGASPGLTNVGVRYMAGHMDRVVRADISCYQPLDAGGGRAVLEHMMYIMSGEVAVWRGGERTMTRACSETRSVEFPRFGPIQLWNMGHSEPYTVPRAFPDIEEVTFFMGYGKGAEALVRPARWGWFESPRRAALFAGLLERLERLTRSGPPGLGALRIDVWGERAGQPVHELACGVGEMREVTGLALSVGALMVARGQLRSDAPGVLSPEDCLDPDLFIQQMATKGVIAYRDLAMTQPLVGG